VLELINNPDPTEDDINHIQEKVRMSVCGYDLFKVQTVDLVDI